jgi:hypothetical protein
VKIAGAAALSAAQAQGGLGILKTDQALSPCAAKGRKGRIFIPSLQDCAKRREALKCCGWTG